MVGTFGEQDNQVVDRNMEVGQRDIPLVVVHKEAAPLVALLVGIRLGAQTVG